jgi:hypothetical protein
MQLETKELFFWFPFGDGSGIFYSSVQTNPPLLASKTFLLTLGASSGGEGSSFSAVAK